MRSSARRDEPRDRPRDTPTQADPEPAVAPNVSAPPDPPVSPPASAGAPPGTSPGTSAGAPPGASTSARVAKGTAWVIAWRLASRNVGLVSTLILVRLLEPSDFGLIAIATGVIASVDALSAIGVQDALIRDRNRDRALYDTGFAISLVRGVITAILIALLAWPAANFFNEPRLAVVFLALAVGVMISSAENIGIVDFRRDLDFRKEFDLQFRTRLIGVAVTVGTALIWHSYWALVAGLLASRVVRLILTYTMSDYRPRLSLKAWNRIAGFSAWSWLVGILARIEEQANNVVTGHSLGTEAAGMLSIGTEIGRLPTTELLEPLNRALFPGFAEVLEAKATKTALFLETIGLGVLVALPAGFGISLVAHPMVNVTLGARWEQVVPLIEIIAPVTTASIFGIVGGTLLVAQGLMRQIVAITAAAAVSRVALLIVGITMYGLVGAAVAAGLSLLIMQGVVLRLTLHRVGLSFAALGSRLWRPAVAVGAMVAVMHACGMAWTPATSPTLLPSLLDLCERSAVGAVVYVAAAAGLWVLSGRPDGAERHVLNSTAKVVRKLRRKI